MTKKEYAEQARKACCSAETTAHHGGGHGRPFWNAEAFQFMYVPSFQFQPIPGCRHYRFTARDEKGGVHTFDAEKPSALLTEIWADIPEGVVELTVRTVNKDNSEGYLVGARTFFKLAPFSADLPAAKCSYKDSAARALRYIMNLDFIRYWSDHGVPDPNYKLNIYPSKIHSSVIGAMVSFSALFPEQAEEALKIAVHAADYLLQLTLKDGPMCGIPPTYSLDYDPNAATRSIGSIIEERYKTVMMLYPSYVGSAYLQLEEKNKDKKYLDAAVAIGEYYYKTVEENGSWYLIRDYETGEPVNFNYCDPLPNIMPFIMRLYQRTGDEKWKTLADNALRFVENNALVRYDWEGQFEDSTISDNYSNLTHYGAAALIEYYTRHYAHDEEKMKIADDLMRFVEDQFVLWHRPSPWQRDNVDTSLWHTPGGLEQYVWHVPIDASTANIMLAFLNMYKAGRGELHLVKAKALADSMTHAQHEDGMIPTHWMNKETLDGGNFWVNCMIASARAMKTMADFEEENG